MAVSFKTPARPGGGIGCMNKTPDFDAAAAFMAGHARVLDRRMFQRLFCDGAAGPVRDAVAAYRNSDGGFGYALEPDCRAAASQPAAVEMALRMMDLADEWDSRLVSAAVDWLAAVAPAEGGAAFVEPSVAEGPHAPWWVPEAGHPASLIQTGQICGVLHARGFAHPWLDRATEVMWSRIDALTSPGGYEMFGVLAFLQHVPDRARADGGVLAGRAAAYLVRAGRPRPGGRGRGALAARLRAAALVARPGAVLRGHDRRAPGPPGRGAAATTAAGCSTGRPGRPRPRPTGAASSPSTRCGCCAPTAAPDSRRAVEVCRRRRPAAADVPISTVYAVTRYGLMRIPNMVSAMACVPANRQADRWCGGWLDGLFRWRSSRRWSARCPRRRQRRRPMTAAEQAGPAGWRISQVLAGVTVGGLWAGGTQDAWLAGDECADPATCGNSDAGNGTVVVRHWDGRAWRMVTPPKAYINSPLDQGVAAVAATSGTNAWVLAGARHRRGRLHRRAAPDRERMGRPGPARRRDPDGRRPFPDAAVGVRRTVLVRAARLLCALQRRNLDARVVPVQRHGDRCPVRRATCGSAVAATARPALASSTGTGAGGTLPRCLILASRERPALGDHQRPGGCGAARRLG